MRSRFLFLAWGCLVLLPPLAETQETSDKTKPKAPLAEPRVPAVQFIAGQFREADLKEGTVRLKTRAGDSTYNLSGREIPITGDMSSKMELKQLAPGTRVLLKMSRNDDVVGIHCIGPQLRTRLQAIDARKRTVTIPGGETIPLAPNAQIVVGGRYPKLEDVPARGMVFLRLTVDRKQVLRLHVDRPGSGTGPLNDNRAVEGVLEQIDLAKGTFRVRVERDSKKETKTYPSSAWVRTSMLDGRGNGLADLMPGMTVKLWFAPDQDEVIFVRAEPTLRGVLKTVDLAGNTITLEAPRGQPEKVLVLEKHAQMMIHGWDSELQDFQPGWTVSIVLTPQGRVCALWTLVNLLDN